MYSEDNGLKYYEVSAKTGQGVQELFKTVEESASKYVAQQKADNASNQPEPSKIDPKPGKSPSGCC